MPASAGPITAVGVPRGLRAGQMLELNVSVAGVFLVARVEGDMFQREAGASGSPAIGGWRAICRVPTGGAMFSMSMSPAERRVVHLVIPGLASA